MSYKHRSPWGVPRGARRQVRERAAGELRERNRAARRARVQDPHARRRYNLEPVPTIPELVASNMRAMQESYRWGAR